MSDASPFVISKTEDDAVAEEAPAQGLEGGEGAMVERVGNVEDLIPLCVKHAAGPQISAATFGYDIAQMERRPWEDPAAKQSDYFNYGFNETSWRLYCAMQSEGEESLLAKANEMLRKLQVASHGEDSAPAGEGPGATGGDANPYGSAPAGSGPYGSGGGYRGAGGGGGDHRVFYKTKLCQRFAEGRCTKGSDCSYAHGIEELRSAPPAVGGGGGGGGYGPDIHLHQQQQGPPMLGAGGGGYMTPQQYGMAPFLPGGGMGPMPMYTGGGGFHMGAKHPRGEDDGY